MANIYYFGISYTNTTTYHRASALKRLGHNVIIYDPYTIIANRLNNKIQSKIHYITGYFFLEKVINEWLLYIINTSPKPDVIWVDSGELFGPTSLKILKIWNCPVILYNIDDLTGKRDGNRFKNALRSLLAYDLVVVVRPETQYECQQLGAKRVIRVYRSYDEKAHLPFDNLEEIPLSFKSEVAFIGTWMKYERRDKFLAQLMDNGVPLSIWGDRWQKSSYWEKLKHSYKGASLGGRDYTAAIQGAKVCIGFLSSGNRDQHTTRSLEIPYAAGLLCAERTSEHTYLYKEGVEAVFWSSAEECARLCHFLLNNDTKREEIRLAGIQRVKELKLGNENVCEEILKLV
ncbi:CgeB family protein [Spirosoma foliorum]|uniref:Glycosyltransferase n=1 Tax=Spirosoma foliorum TaxID=2710596 RepID=A0A7G5GYN4_9BACT|nr:glycosyltransferase [Spirosoma foliorum]QMW03976.1 glycosyltransferase [Spirosoma foliorum]